MIEPNGGSNSNPAEISRLLAEMEELIGGFDVGPISEDALPLTSRFLRAGPGATIADRHQEWPRLHTSVFYSPHKRSVDVAGMSDALQRSDILLIEAANGGEDNGFVQALQDVADNDAGHLGQAYIDNIVRQNNFEGTQDEFYMREVYGTRKKVSSIDLTEASLLSIGDLLLSSLAIKNHDGSYDGVLDAQNERAVNFANKERQRQKIIAPRLEKKIGQLLLSSNLFMKEELNVLLTMGRLHHPTFTRELNGLGFDIFALVQGDETVNNKEQLIRAHMLGQAPLREIVARAFLEDKIDEVMPPQMKKERGYSDTRWLAYVGMVAAAFDVEEIKPVHKMSQKFMWSLATADELLVSKGLAPLPKTVPELNVAVRLS